MIRVLRAAALSAGLAATGFGLYGLLSDPFVTAPAGVLWWAVGALVLHDGLWLPVVCLTGALVAAAGPERPAVLRGWLIVAAAVTAVGLPAVALAGRNTGNPTLLPSPYLRNWLLLLAGTAALAVVVPALVARARRRRPGSRDRA
ncbi:hypothetical protein AB0O91_07340 [Kitasatospora sp. NPDC089797]|uniref:hypothetical protein n=1 Tax=Kitasatospora sp. NPDC089797 TaxID=3155298 RepID=UPI003419980C